MKAELPQFEYHFTHKDAERVAHNMIMHPHVQAVYMLGSLDHSQTVQILQFVIEVDDEDLFYRFAENFKKKDGDQSIATEQRMTAVSCSLGDEFLFGVDDSFRKNQNAGNFIDIVIVPPDWRKRIDFVQSRLPFDDILASDLVGARELISK